MKVLVLGGTGMAGHIISVYLKEIGYNITAFSRKEFKYSNNIVGDILDFSFLKDTISKGGYDAVINAVGILNKDAEEDKANAVLLNSYLPHFLSDITKEMKTKVIHMSTDCVFSGETGNYKEDSLKDGKTFYDRTKALGEIENNKDLTFRNSIIGPDMKIEGTGLFNWFMKQEGEIQGYNKAIWTGVTTLTLAKAIDQALKSDLTGLYNLVNNKSINKYDLLSLFNEQIRESEVQITSNDAVILDKSLINTRTDFEFIVPEYERMIIEMKDWIERHKYLYPHYYTSGGL